mgnify:CR=1 FL=1
MNICFHIGQAKTGTTAIQKCFSKNRQELLGMGFLYPKSVFGGNNHGVMAIPIMGFVQRTLKSKVGADYDRALDAAHEAWAAAAQEARQTRPHTIIISSEFFFKARNVREISQIVERHFGTVSEMTFLAYVRRPSQHYVSFMQQQLRANHRVPVLKVDPILEQLVKYSEIGEVRVQRFSRESMYDGDVTHDICEKLGVDFVKLKPNPAEQNVSLSAEGTIVLQQYRRDRHRNRNNVFTEDTHDLIRQILREEAEHHGGYTKLCLRPEIAQALDRDTPEMHEIRSRFGVDLSHDYNASAMPESELSKLTDVAQMVAYDPALLQRMHEVTGQRHDI